MYKAPTKNIVIFSSLMAALLVIWSLNLIKGKENGVTGQIIFETAADKTSMFIVFILVSLLVGGLILMSVMYKQKHRY